MRQPLFPNEGPFPMKNWHDTLISQGANILDALRTLDATACQICLVTDETGRLLGSITDGDIRRGILSGLAMSSPAIQVMNTRPKTAVPGTSTAALAELMRIHDIRQIPLLNDHGQVVGLARLEDLTGRPTRRDNLVVLMAGGQGKRLRPLTEDTPKPLLPVGGRPILERILDGLIEQGFHRFAISVNYHAQMIIDHFGDGARWGVDVSYLREETPLGTAGPLGLLPERPQSPVIVMNGDLLTQVNLSKLLDYHADRHAHASMGVRKYDFQVPFGVVRLEGDEMVGIDEKPTHEFFVNAGIYALDALTIGLIRPGQAMDMPDLFSLARRQGQRTIAFPIHEYWLDIGRMDDFEKANTVIGQMDALP